MILKSKKQRTALPGCKNHDIKKTGATTHDAPPSSAGHSRAVWWAVFVLTTDGTLLYHPADRLKLIACILLLNLHTCGRLSTEPFVNQTSLSSL
jgi:hypothetical protein